MSWQYCRTCHTGLELPTLRERLTGEYLCPCCGDNQEIVGFSEAENMSALLDRIELLENFVYGENKK